MLSKKWNHLIETILLFFAISAILVGIWDYSVFNVFQSRDLDRAYQLLSGGFLFSGPEASGGGSTPGSLYYWILALGLLLGHGWKGCWILMIGMTSLGGVMLWSFVKRSFGSFAAYLSLVFFLAPAAQKYFLAAFFNASFLHLFVVLTMTNLILSFYEKNPKRNKHWAIACISCGLGVQIHFSIGILLLAGIVLQLFSKFLRLSRLSLKAFTLGSVLFFVPLAPFMLWKIFGTTSVVTGESSDAFELLLFLFKYASAKHLTLSIFFQRFFQVVPLLPLLSTVVVLVFYSFTRFKQKTRKCWNKEWHVEILTAIKVLGVVAFFTAVPAIFYLGTGQAIRYATIFVITFSLLASLLLCLVVDQSSKTSHLKIFIAGSVLFFLLAECIVNGVPLGFNYLFVIVLLISILLIALLYFQNATCGVFILVITFLTFSTSYQFNSIQTLVRMLRFKEHFWIAEQIYSATGWSYSKARNRVYYIGHHAEDDIRYIYQSVQQKSSSDVISDDLVSGFFVSLHNDNNVHQTSESYLKWLLTQYLDPVMEKALISKQIVLKQPLSYSRISLVPYRSTVQPSTLPFFQNTGFPYDKSPIAETLNKHAKKQKDSAIINIDPQRFILFWNDHPTKDPVGAIGFFVTIFRTDFAGYSHKIEVVVDGEALSQPTFFLFPSWKQILHEPFIELTCDDSSSKDFLLAKTIGMEGKGYFAAKRSFSTPFTRQFYIRCSDTITRIRAGWKLSNTKQYQKFFQLPGRSLTLDFEE